MTATDCTPHLHVHGSTDHGWKWTVEQNTYPGRRYPRTTLAGDLADTWHLALGHGLMALDQWRNALPVVPRSPR
jgi:hypothetical protein